MHDGDNSESFTRVNIFACSEKTHTMVHNDPSIFIKVCALTPNSEIFLTCSPCTIPLNGVNLHLFLFRLSLR